MKLNNSTATCIVRGESGCENIEDIVKNRMLNFWARIVNGNQSKLSNILYKSMLQKYESGEYKSKWLYKIHNSLNCIGYGNIWSDKMPFNVNWFKKSVKAKLNDIDNQNWKASINDTSLCRFYKEIKSEKVLEYYLINLDKRFLIPFCKFRASNHKLPIVTGRYIDLDLKDRLCTLCSSRSIGDEMHYLQKCQYFDKDRQLCFESKPSVSDIYQLFNSEDVVVLESLAKFISIIMNAFKI
jgi:hypothetical protein